MAIAKNHMKPFRSLGDVFLLAVLIASLIGSYIVLEPFVWVILISAVLAAILYPVHERILKLVKGRENIAAVISTLLVILVIIVPIVNLIYLVSAQSIETYTIVERMYQNGELDLAGRYESVRQLVDQYGAFLNSGGTIDFQKYLIDVTGKINEFLVSSTTDFIRGATSVVTSFLLVILTMFFFFRDGKRMLQRLMYLTPLSNQYDHELYESFREISMSTIVATLLTALAQGFVGALGFYFVGIPGVLFWGVAMAFMSIIPLIGPVVIWLPAAIILMLTGQLGAGIFILLWGAVVVSLIDNLLRPMLIKGKTKVHTLFVFFSILGGIAIFGFWGVVFGPMVLAITLTLLKIYELEYKEILEQ